MAAVAAITIAVFTPIRRAVSPVPVPAPASAPSPSVHTSIKGLARLEPMPVLISRDDAPAHSFEEERMLGLEAYEGAAYDSAAAHLSRALDLEPDHEVGLYLGSAELLRGDTDAAVRRLADVAARSQSPSVQSEAMWQLANALTSLDQREPALAVARQLKTVRALHQADADTLIARIGRTSPAY